MPKTRDETQQWNEIAEQMINAASAELEALYNETGNPLYVFKMIERLFSAEMARSVGETYEFGSNVVLPKWVFDYLVHIGMGLEMLASRQDVRDFPIYSKRNEDEFHREAAEWRQRRDTDPARASELVPQIMGLTRKGWNAFSDYASRKIRQWDLADFELLKQRGMSGTEARGAMLEKLGLSEERSLRRRFREARHKRGKKNS